MLRVEDGNAAQLGGLVWDEGRGRAAGGDAGGSAGVPKGMIAPATWPARRQWRRCDHEPDASSSWRGHFLRSLARTGARGRCAATSAFLITDRSGHGSLLGRRVAAVSLLATVGIRFGTQSSPRRLALGVCHVHTG